MFKSLGKFTEERFQNLKQGFKSDFQSLGKMSEQGFQGLKNQVSRYTQGQKESAIGQAFQGVGAGLMGDAQGVNEHFNKFISAGKKELPELSQAYGEGMSVGSLGPIKGITTKVGQEALKDSVYNGLKKLEFPATIKNPIERFETQMNIMSKIEKGLATADDLRSGSELIKLMESGKSPISKAKASGQSFDEWVKGQTKMSQFTDEGKTGKFWTTPEGADSGYGGVKKNALIDLKNPKIFKGTSSLDYLEEKGLLTPKVKKAISDAADSNDPMMEYKIPQDIAEEALKKEGYSGAHWTYEDDLNPTQYQIWDKSVIKTRSQLKAEWDTTQPKGVEP